MGQVPFSNLTYEGGRLLQLRANINASVPLIEFQACLPNGTWLGVGLGGSDMLSTELLFFFAGFTQNDSRRVLSLRLQGDKQDEPSNYPQSSPVYNYSIGTCGEGMVQIWAQRPLDTSGHPNGSSVEERLVVGESIQMIVAAAY